MAAKLNLFEIKVKGHLDQRHLKLMAQLDIIHQPGGETALIGPIPDQAALYGLLNRLRDLGVPLISVNPVESADGPTAPL